MNPLTVSARLCLLAIVGLPGVSADAQLLHRYDFETVGSANDTVGTAHGTIYGTATVSGGALNTTGGTGSLSGGVPQNCVGLPPSAVAGITNAFSIEIWFNATFNGAWCTLFSFSANNTANYLLATTATGFSPYPSRVEVVGGGGSSGYQQAHQIYTDNASLHDMVVAYDGTNVAYYLDGSLSTYSGLQNSFTDLGLNLSTLTYIGIGGGSPYADNTINGKVYDFRIYGKAVTAAQVAAVYSLGTNPSSATIAAALMSPELFNAPVACSLQMPVYGDYWAHDPSRMIKQGNTYFVYRTSQGIMAKYSTDLRNWTYGGQVFPNGPPSWTSNAVPGFTGSFWAPDIVSLNGVYYLYYACSSWGSQVSAIGLATTTNLATGAWTDRGAVIQSTTGDPYNCIDPCPLVDTNGALWLSFGSYWNGVYLAQLDPTTGKRLSSNLTLTRLASGSIEASFLYQRGGYYYLFVNWGSCCNGIDSTYNIRVGRSTQVTGPYLDRNGVDLVNGGGSMFLESTARFVGPGHAGILDDNGTNWFTYHYYDGNNSGTATLGLTTLGWSVDGWPLLTNDWSAFYPFNTDAREHLGLYNGALTNGAAVANEPGRGNVLSLDGVSQYVLLPDPVANASTFAGWAKWNGGAAWQRIFDFGANTGAYLFLTPSSGSGNLRFAISTSGTGGEQQISAPSALPTNSWVHVAVTLDGSKGLLYLDGSPVATNANLTLRPWQILARSNYLGKSQWPADPLFNGRLDSFRVFGRALSGAEIMDLAQAHPDLAHRYSFARSAWDAIGMAHGTLQGNAVVTNGALKLTGAAGGYVNLPGGLVSGSSAFTLECWATLGANGNWARIVDFGDINGNLGQNFLFYSPHSSSGGQRLGLPTFNLDAPGTLDNRTVQIVCIVDPANSYCAIYTNAVLQSAVTAALPALAGVSGAWSFIGRSLYSADAWLNGTINELRLYDGRLSPDQIAADYRAGPDALALPISLTLSNSASGLNVSWPSYALGFVAESSPALGSAAAWTLLSQTPVLNNDRWQLTLPASNSAQFFRLRR